MFESFVKQIIFKRKLRWLRHLLLLTFFFIIVVWLDSNQRGDLSTPIYIFIFFTPIILVYANVIIYWLIPSFLLKRKYLPFFLLYCCWTSISLTLIFLDENYVFGPFFGTPAQHYTLLEAYRQIFSLNNFLDMHIFTMLCVFGKLFKYWYLEQQQKQQVEKQKIIAELELLKAQLHPHFLFNTLNNLYTLVYEKSDRAPKMLMRLSGLLSYVLYECKADEVLLSKEITVIKDYVSLEKERYGDRLDISLNFSGDIEDKLIAPMLLQPFIENAFKHGTAEQLGKVWMSIDLSVKKCQMHFKIINSCENNIDLATQKKGIGIENVKKRLELLYPGRYQLNNSREDDVYLVTLQIELYDTSLPRNPATGHLFILNHAS
jgi:sensor histidine kinase YesM